MKSVTTLIYIMIAAFIGYVIYKTYQTISGLASGLNKTASGVGQDASSALGAISSFASDPFASIGISYDNLFGAPGTLDVQALTTPLNPSNDVLYGPANDPTYSDAPGWQLVGDAP